MFENITDVLGTISRNRKVILWITAGFTLFAAVVSFVIPNKYKATVVMMPPVTQGTNLLSIMTRTNILAEPEVGGTGYLPGVVTPSDVFAYMMGSSTVTDIVINECDLVDHYKKRKLFITMRDKAAYQIAKKLRKATKIKVTDERFITVTVEDRSKYKAAEIANKYAEALDRVYASMTMTQGGKMREFIEKRLLQEGASLKQAEDSLRSFQQRYKTVSMTDEMKAVIEMSATLEAKIIGQKIELDAIRSYADPENSQVKVLENQIGKAQEELRNLLQGSRGKTLFVSFSQAPEIGLLFGQLTRDVKIHQELYVLLVQQLEQAKILEAKDTPKVQVLDRATPPYKKSWPLRSLLIAAGFLIGLLVSAVTLIVLRYRERIDADPGQREAWRLFFAIFQR